MSGGGGKVSGACRLHSLRGYPQGVPRARDSAEITDATPSNSNLTIQSSIRIVELRGVLLTPTTNQPTFEQNGKLIARAGMSGADNMGGMNHVET